MLQDYKSQEIRTSAILTTSYVAGTVIEKPMQNQLVLLVSFTIGSLTSAEIKVEFSDDGTTYYQETVENAPSSGIATADQYVRQLTASGNYRFAIPIKDRYIKVSVKGTGTVTSSAMALKAVTGIA